MHVRISDFLSAFFPGADEPIHLRAFKAKGAVQGERNKPALIEVSRLNLTSNKKTQDYLVELNKTRGIYFVVNSGGHSDKDITRFNAFFCECDDLPLADQHALFDNAPIQPSIRLQTLKSVHAYWLVDGECSEADWREIQARLIAYFKSDATIKNPSRVMRLPFFNHVSLNGNGAYHYKSVELVVFDPERRYIVKVMLEAFPPVGTASEKKTDSSAHSHTNSGFSNWAALKAELGRRIISHPTANQNSKGRWDCRGICHNGNGDSGLFYNPKTNAAYCNKDCDLATILRAFGLPQRPRGSDSKQNHNDAESQEQTELSETIKLRCLADVQPEFVDFLWYPYIPKGKLTLIEGDPGVGKSWLTCALATAAAGKGPPGWMQEEPANVLLLSVEDGLGDTIRPRLDAMQADVKRIFAIEGAMVFNDAGLLRLEAEIIDLRPALVVIDPLVAYLGAGVDIHRANETRAITARLALIAEKYGCAITAVRHLTKSGRDRAIYRGIGSIDFTAACRSALLVGNDPQDPSQRAVVHIKSNLAEMGCSVGYQIQEGNFYWTGSSSLTAEQILSASEGAEKTDSLEGEEFLKQILAEGERKADEIKKEARSIGISEWQLRKARAKLAIKPKKIGQPGEDQYWIWKLPNESEDESLAEVGPEDEKEKEASHLRTNGSDKEFNASHLAEDESGSSFTHLRQTDSHLRIEENSLHSGFVICPVDGVTGLRHRHCDQCGEFLR